MWINRKLLLFVCLWEEKWLGKEDRAEERLVDRKEGGVGMDRIVHILHKASTG